MDTRTSVFRLRIERVRDALRRHGLAAVLVPALVALGGWLAFPLAGLAAIATLAVVTNWRQAPPPQGGPDDPGAGEGGSATTRADRSYVQ